MRLFFRFYSKFIGAEFYGIIFFNVKNLFFREFDKFRLVFGILDWGIGNEHLQL